MFKITKKILINILIAINIFMVISNCYAGVVDDSIIGGKDKITEVSMGTKDGDDSLEKINNTVLSVFHTIKVIMGGVILIYLIYLGFQMIMAMGAEDKLAGTKKQIYYSLLAFLFINIPGELYSLFSGKDNSDVTDKVINYKDVDDSGTSNMFINFDAWRYTMNQGVIGFIKVIIVGIVILIFLMAGSALISSGGNEDKKKKARYRFINGIIGLIFIGFIEVWTFVVYKGDVNKGQGVFAQLSNMALFFAGPLAIFFLVMGGFYYITSAGDEGKAKKGITIIKNTFLAVIILLASYAFLKDLADFSAE